MELILKSTEFYKHQNTINYNLLKHYEYFKSYNNIENEICTNIPTPREWVVNGVCL